MSAAASLADPNTKLMQSDSRTHLISVEFGKFKRASMRNPTRKRLLRHLPPLTGVQNQPPKRAQNPVYTCPAPLATVTAPPPSTVVIPWLPPGPALTAHAALPPPAIAIPVPASEYAGNVRVLKVPAGPMCSCPICLELPPPAYSAPRLLIRLCALSAEVFGPARASCGGYCCCCCCGSGGVVCCPVTACVAKKSEIAEEGHLNTKNYFSIYTDFSTQNLPNSKGEPDFST